VKVTFDPEAWDEYLAWQREDTKVLERINTLIEECRRDPFRGVGKPEPLRQNLAGWWSRRITGEHRLVYRVRGAGETRALEVLSCRYFY
jgi:toxin YoeB